MKSLSRVWPLATPWTIACQAPQSIHGVFQAKLLEWVAISFSRGVFPTQGLNQGLLHCRQTLLPSEPPGKSFLPLKWDKIPARSLQSLIPSQPRCLDHRILQLVILKSLILVLENLSSSFHWPSCWQRFFWVWLAVLGKNRLIVWSVLQSEFNLMRFKEKAGRGRGKDEVGLQRKQLGTAQGCLRSNTRSMCITESVLQSWANPSDLTSWAYPTTSVTEKMSPTIVFSACATSLWLFNQTLFQSIARLPLWLEEWGK